MNFSAKCFLLFLLIIHCVSAQAWRSTLYPENWTPDATYTSGRFLHDVSYAGYHRGELPIPTRAGAPVFDVVKDFAADATGGSDTTAAIQAAIDAAAVAGGGIVYLPAGLYRCDGKLDVTASNTLIRGAGRGATKIYFTKFDAMAYKAHIQFRGPLQQGADVLLAEAGENRAFTVKVDDASSFGVGDRVALGWFITDAFVEEHKMTGTWVTFNGKWKPFIRRAITAIDTTVTPHSITFDIPLRYPAKLRDTPSIRLETGYIRECGIEHLSIANAVAYDDAWSQNQVAAIDFTNAMDCWVQAIDSFDSPYGPASYFHLQSKGIVIEGSNRITVADCSMDYAQNRGGSGNGYLFEITRCNEVLIRDCSGKNGRHNFIQNWDFGTSGCVFLRCYSRGSTNMLSKDIPFGLPAYCEYHHSIATACLVDSCELDDGWYGGNRNDWSSGAGHSVTQSVYWNTSGKGEIRSWQYGMGYIIGTGPQLSVNVLMIGDSARGTEPVDYREGTDIGGNLEPASLYESQLARRLALLSTPNTPADIHSADLNRDHSIDLAELLRLIQLFNGQGLSCDSQSEDGYQVGDGGGHGCSPHDSDALQTDWRISMSELLRAIQFYNDGCYAPCDTKTSTTEDGFCLCTL